jgi:hypothetical protein
MLQGRPFLIGSIDSKNDWSVFTAPLFRLHDWPRRNDLRIAYLACLVMNWKYRHGWRHSAAIMLALFIGARQGKLAFLTLFRANDAHTFTGTNVRRV